jgi:hypothetical protein
MCAYMSEFRGVALVVCRIYHITYMRICGGGWNNVYSISALLFFASEGRRGVDGGHSLRGRLREKQKPAIYTISSFWICFRDRKYIIQNTIHNTINTYNT